ncbi:ABC transporter permease [Rhodovulum sp. DZ06]|uniref:ABC transporter permease n=1 Tax=Rhodovulum sp. DZ06 TaxID=3425126 RepID=UPI003D33B1AC
MADAGGMGISGAGAAPPARRRASLAREALRFCLLCHALAVQGIARQSTGSFGLLAAFATPVALCAGFLAAYEILGLFRPAIRGDVVIFLLTGIYLFQLAARARGAADLNGGGALLWHQPVQPALVVWSGALGAFYITVTSMGLILTGAALWRGVPPAADPAGLGAPLLLAWGFGVGSGMVMSGISRYAGGAQLMGMLWQRAMFLTSGIFFLASAIPGWLRPFFDWNPLFHIIDAMRMAAFVNYGGGDTSLEYAALCVAGLLAVGHALERKVRADFSISRS